MPRLNIRELDVLNILWMTDKPMTSTDIANQQIGLTKSTAITVLRKLVKEQLAEVVGITHSGKVLSRTYRPTERSRKVIIDNFVGNYVSFKNVVSKSEMCTVILSIEQDPELMKTEVSKLKKVLDYYEKELND